MAEHLDIDLSGSGPAPATDVQAELKRKLAKRMGFALVMIAVLLGALAVFDRLSRTDEIEPPAPRPPVLAPRQEVAQPLAKPAAIAGDGATASVDKAAVVTPEPPAAPPQPEVAARPSPSPATQPATQPAARTDVRPEPKPLPAAPPAAVAETSAAPASVPAAPPAAAPAPRPPVTAAPRPASGYILQAGVFSSARRAEEVYARLQLNGIPSTLEARVQAGPFKSRDEAEAAREKLKALGIDAVLVPPRGGRR